ncbi:MAG TPA: sugar transferase [Solirubrobacteraceae bacterium]|jgi:exopolysaccharide biosynthesis polyprenyl glycosylphosphotransferase
MSATDSTAMLDGLVTPHDELYTAVGPRTLAILERRRNTSVVKRRGWLVRRLLLTADLTGLVGALLLSEWLVGKANGRGALDAPFEIVAFVAALPLWVLVTKLYGLYDRDEERTDHSTADDVGGVFNMITVCTWLFWVVTQVTGIAHPTASKLFVFWGFAIVFVSLCRSVARAFARRHIAYLQNAVIVGAGDTGQLVARKLLQHPEYGINVVGFVDSEPKERDESLAHIAVLGDTSKLRALISLFDIERVIIAFSRESHGTTLDVIRDLRDLNVQIDILPRLFEVVGPNAGMHMVEGLPLVGLPPLRLARSSAMLKRALDLLLSAAALLVLSPLLLAITLAIKLDSPGPALYRHERVGRNGRKIAVLKFRTMRREACRGARYGGGAAEAIFKELMSEPSLASEFQGSQKFADDPRVTRLGRLLRRTSLDELPQLLNVVRSDLSLVGPRAITNDELGRYGENVGDLLRVRPGVTGYWQINGRSRLSYEDRVRLDLSYLTSWSLRLDLVILAKTLRTLVASGDAY